MDENILAGTGWKTTDINPSNWHKSHLTWAHGEPGEDTTNHPRCDAGPSQDSHGRAAGHPEEAHMNSGRRCQLHTHREPCWVVTYTILEVGAIALPTGAWHLTKSKNELLPELVLLYVDSECHQHGALPQCMMYSLTGNYLQTHNFVYVGWVCARIPAP